MAGVDGQLGNFGNSYPTVGELAEWGNYDFMDPLAGNNRTYVARLSDEQYTGLNWKYPGFGGFAASYRIISNARRASSGNNIVVGVRQDVQVAEIPIFEFGVFYALEMELCPAAGNFSVTGRVHCNTNIYCKPDLQSVTFYDHVTASGEIIHDNSPNDSTSRTFGSVTYLAERDSKVKSLNLPIGAANPNDPVTLHKIIEIPPSPDETTPLGRQRYYNKADLIILVTNNTPMAYSGVNNGFFNVTSYVTNFVYVSTNNTFINKRENKDILYTELDISKFSAAANYNSLKAVLAGDPKIVYIADQRPLGPNQESGVRLIKGQFLPAAGLTVATLNPLYVKDHYNAPDVGSTNTSNAKPASLIADAITVLSGNWDDTKSGGSLTGRPASDTTVNAAIIAGIVPSAGGAYSGGVERFIRLLEDWNPSGKKALTFNGSMVALFASQIATGPAGFVEVNNPPSRKYGFDVNFKDPNRLPPGTPRLRTVIRSQWAAMQPNTVL